MSKHTKHKQSIFTNIYLNGSSQNKIRSLIVCIAHLFNNLFLNCNRQHSSVACSQNSIFVFKFSSYVIAMQAGSTLWRHSMFGYASMRRLILATIDGSQYNYNVFVQYMYYRKLTCYRMIIKQNHTKFCIYMNS